MRKIEMQVVILSMWLVMAKADFWSERQEIIKSEEKQAIGSSIVLTPKEKLVNDLLMKYKHEEYDRGINNTKNFYPSQPVLKWIDDVQSMSLKSKVFKFIRKMPKGALLHSHDVGMVYWEYMLYNITYMDDIYACDVNAPSIKDTRLNFHFFKNNQTNKDCKWQSLVDLRENGEYDKYIRHEIVMQYEYEPTTDPDEQWHRFASIRATVASIINYGPVLQRYFYAVLLQLYEDGIKYLEFRGEFASVYDENGKNLTTIEAVGLIKTTVETFKKDHPDFQGARMIYTVTRQSDNATIETYIYRASELKRKYPDFVIGFDMWSEQREDLSTPLSSFSWQLKYLHDVVGLKFFLHAGETKRFLSNADLNLIDAVVLNATRIGLGFGLYRHPKVLELIKKRNIAIELCPISDQVMHLVEDQLNHPASALIARGYPIVIGNGHPGLYGTNGVAYDWYVVFMALASRDMDLRFLKQLAFNSISYSSMADKEKIDAMLGFTRDWDKFITEMLLKPVE